MKLAAWGLTTTVTVAGLLSLDLSLSPSARASIPCEAGTINNFSNGSLDSCVLETNVNAELNNNIYPCQRGKWIAFDEQGRFRSCVLSTGIDLRNGRGITSCQANYGVSVSISSRGNQFVSCIEEEFTQIIGDPKLQQVLQTSK